MSACVVACVLVTDSATVYKQTNSVLCPPCRQRPHWSSKASYGVWYAYPTCSLSALSGCVSVGGSGQASTVQVCAGDVSLLAHVHSCVGMPTLPGARMRANDRGRMLFRTGLAYRLQRPHAIRLHSPDHPCCIFWHPDLRMYVCVFVCRRVAYSRPVCVCVQPRHLWQVRSSMENPHTPVPHCAIDRPPSPPTTRPVCVR